MTSSIYNGNSSWDVSNMMFERVLDFGIELAESKSLTENENYWLNRLKKFLSSYGFSIDIDMNELFRIKDEKDFWSNIFFELADKIYKREIGNQDNQEWQVSTIWASYSLARLLACGYI